MLMVAPSDRRYLAASPGEMFAPASVQVLLEERWELRLGLAQEPEQRQGLEQEGQVGSLLPLAAPLLSPDRVRFFSIEFDV